MDVSSPLAELERAAQGSGKSRFTLRLYVAGMTRRSSIAVQTIRDFCEEFLQGRYQLDVVDIYREPDQARLQQIIAAPTLVKTLPPPLRRLIGDMSDKDKILLSLDLKPAPKRSKSTDAKREEG